MPHGTLNIAATFDAAQLSDEGLRDAREHYATLLEARPKPHVLDDATIERTSASTARAWSGATSMTASSRAGKRLRLAGAQREEVTRLQGVQRELRAV